MKTKIFLTVILLIAATAMINAQAQGRGRSSATQNAPRVAWVDQDNNGVCDNFTRGNPGGQGKGAGKGNGTCDGTAKGKGTGKGNANGAGNGTGKGKGTKFADTDNDGVCDNFPQKSN